MNVISTQFTGGVFVPLEPVEIEEGTKIQVQIRSQSDLDWKEWMKSAAINRQKIMDRVGVLPDSTPEIRADRYRDE